MPEKPFRIEGESTRSYLKRLERYERWCHNRKYFWIRCLILGIGLAGFMLMNAQKFNSGEILTLAEFAGLAGVVGKFLTPKFQEEE